MAKEVIKLIFKTLHMIIENTTITKDDISKLVSNAKNKYEHRNEVNLKITAEDNESKPENIKIAIYNEEEYKNIKSYTSINFAYNYVDGGLETKHQTTPGDGLKRIYVIFKDKAGNISMTIKQLP